MENLYGKTSKQALKLCQRLLQLRQTEAEDLMSRRDLLGALVAFHKGEEFIFDRDLALKEIPFSALDCLHAEEDCYAILGVENPQLEALRKRTAEFEVMYAGPFCSVGSYINLGECHEVRRVRADAMEAAA